MLHRPRITPAVANARRAMLNTLPADLHNQLVLIALSGGRDSLAAMVIASWVIPRLNGRVGAVVVDHGLQENSARIADEVRIRAEQFALNPILIKRVSPSRVSAGPEASARIARYAAFYDTLEETKAYAIILAHTLDDQAETVLLGLMRGSGPSSLRGMKAVSYTPEDCRYMNNKACNSVTAVYAHNTQRCSCDSTQRCSCDSRPYPPPPEPRNENRSYFPHPSCKCVEGSATRFTNADIDSRFGVFIRPFLDITRHETGKICEFYGLDYWNDPHNEDVRFSRVRIRHNVMPVLENEIGPGVKYALSRTAKLAQLDTEYLDHLSNELLDEIASKESDWSIRLPINTLQKTPVPIRLRVIRLAALQYFTVSLSFKHTRQIERLLCSSCDIKHVNLPRLITAQRVGNYIYMHTLRGKL
ncbi:tRNA lysidine(34) synthetase TilS [Tropheryma whipplei]|uniref:tRNA lysidine(34) synthetase TilS n=1 Tax=Tropheryma whipplei TaxID=2039 RepID=UPI0004AD5AD4|nr:tRNA lysidine(34) synthetase TilS [Tropheryma whipplei]